MQDFILKNTPLPIEEIIKNLIHDVQVFANSAAQQDDITVVGLTSEELEYQIKLMASLKMFELGKISSGKAAELLGTTRVDFFNICSRYRVSVFNYPPGELKKELEADLKTIQFL